MDIDKFVESLSDEEKLNLLMKLYFMPELTPAVIRLNNYQRRKAACLISILRDALLSSNNNLSDDLKIFPERYLWKNSLN